MFGPLTKKRILLVDDEPSFTRLLRLNLESTGRYEVREENRGAAAVAAVEQFAPDLILLDIIMPDQDGASIAEQLRQYGALKHIPIIFVTAVVSKQEAAEQKGTIGGNVFVAKPVSTEELVKQIERSLPGGEESFREAHVRDGGHPRR